ncbi:hypothetical protein K458DRAFT_81067 [Lentithecium fluviatile CBS 122367]|uniref:Uncharacterized protein n=1 Tax=Lentithecium fluviatile CBS 122367 TaxID=1168545 RepID=A0A6G1IT99_9PLEO|nr:hypothetical protein K458DRAFT_81067 [Lentithecium fluviatile CBS 122367]
MPPSLSRHLSPSFHKWRGWPLFTLVSCFFERLPPSSSSALHSQHRAPSPAVQDTHHSQVSYNPRPLLGSHLLCTRGSRQSGVPSAAASGGDRRGALIGCVPRMTSSHQRSRSQLPSVTSERPRLHFGATAI